jgi:DNA-binding response OmpR family regulator
MYPPFSKTELNWYPIPRRKASGASYVPTRRVREVFADAGAFGLLIMDYHLLRASGVDVCRELRSRGDRMPIIFFTGEAHEREREVATGAGAQVYLVKPADIEILAETVEGLAGGRVINSSF